MLWTVEPAWRGETAFVIGGGPSVAGEDLSVLEGGRVVVINSSYTVAPFADYLVFVDVRWYGAHAAALASFRGQIVTTSMAAKVAPGGHPLLRLQKVAPNKEPKGLCEVRNCVVYQRTGLQPALNMLAHLEVARIILIGFDMQRSPKGKTHHHQPHPWANRAGNKSWDLQMEQINFMVEPLRRRGIEVINTSMASRLPWWPKVPLSKVLADLAESQLAAVSNG